MEHAEHILYFLFFVHDMFLHFDIQGVKKVCYKQRQFFRGGEGGQASLTFYQSTNKILVAFVPDLLSYIKMSILIKQKLFTFLLL